MHGSAVLLIAGEAVKAKAILDPGAVSDDCRIGRRYKELVSEWYKGMASCNTGDAGAHCLSGVTLKRLT